MVVFSARIVRLILSQLAWLVVFFVFSVLFWSKPANADLLFEGYSKVLLDGVHVGYFVQRYEFDPKKQEFVSAHFLKTNQTAGNLSESLKARANSKFRPISYQFTEVVGDRPRTIDAVFKNDVMTATINDSGKKQVITKKLAKDHFLSSFLAFVMLAGKEGIKTGVNYQYQAIAEEDAGVYEGNALIASQETLNGVNVFKVLNTFKSAQFISYVTYKGEVIATKSPKQKIASELVGSVREALGSLSFNTNTVNQIFGSVPQGTENPISRRAPIGADAPPAAGTASPQKQKTLEATETPTPGSPKKDGVPAGQGVIIKGAPNGN